jgi:hypothetical protein
MQAREETEHRAVGLSEARLARMAALNFSPLAAGFFGS